jgi:transposase
MGRDLTVVMRSNFWTQPEASRVEVVKGKNDEQQTTPVQCSVQTGDGDGRHPWQKPVAQIGRERDISDSLYYKWRDLFKEHAPEIFNRQEQKDQVVSEQAARIADLERMVGKLALENEILKKQRLGWTVSRGEAGDDRPVEA